MRSLARISLPILLILALAGSGWGRTSAKGAPAEAGLAVQRLVVFETFMRPG